MDDRPADIGSYVDVFGTQIIGLTGSDAQLAQISGGFGVYVKKVPTEGGDYTLDHHEADKVALEKRLRLIG